MISTTVIVVTLNRPRFLERCLSCLHAQTVKPDQIIVVDSSSSQESLHVVENFGGVLYLHNDAGFGQMTVSRNIALSSAHGDIIAYVDDDAFAAPEWLGALITTYNDPSIGAVGGRAINNQPNESVIGVQEIGQILPNGMHTGNFAADSGRIVEVDHVIGCNMSFRRVVLAQLGGFREDYPGLSSAREDTDMCIRVKKLGYRILFNPNAIVEHVGAPLASGSRFDVHYEFYSARNHMTMLLRNYGFVSKSWRYLNFIVIRSAKDFIRRVGGALLLPGTTLVGTLLGIVSGLWFLLKNGLDPVRRDAAGDAIRRHLQATEPPLAPYSGDVSINTP